MVYKLDILYTNTCTTFMVTVRTSLDLLCTIYHPSPCSYMCKYVCVLTVVLFSALTVFCCTVWEAIRGSGAVTVQVYSSD